MKKILTAGIAASMIAAPISMAHAQSYESDGGSNTTGLIAAGLVAAAIVAGTIIVVTNENDTIVDRPISA